ncbi:hypothetical protein [Citrobacter freundii]|nr:hypothetical protein [Citrobacter freundii]
MKAVGYKVPGPIAEDASLVDIDLPRPVAEGGDILVEGFEGQWNENVR